MRFPFVFALLGLAALSTAATDWKAAGQQWWKHVEYLASDDLGGRELGSTGYEKAASYVAAQFERAGLKPGAGSTYFQAVGFTRISLDAGKSTLHLRQSTTVKAIAVPEEAQLGYSIDTAATLDAPVVFAGYGLTIPEARYDDLKSLPVRGAVVAFLTGGPESIDGNLRSHYSSSQQRWLAMHAAGAVGIISIPNPAEMEIPWKRQILSWGKPHMALADPKLAGSQGLKFSASWDPAQAEDLFAGSGHTFAEVLAAAKAKKPLPHMALQTAIQAVTFTTRQQVQSKNVVGIRPAPIRSFGTNTWPSLLTWIIWGRANLSTAMAFITALWTMLPALLL